MPWFCWVYGGYRSVRYRPFKADILSALIWRLAGSLIAGAAIGAAILISRLKERRDPPDNHAAVTPFGSVGRDKQELLAVSLSDKVLARYAELLPKQIRHRLRAPVR